MASFAARMADHEKRDYHSITYDAGGCGHYTLHCGVCGLLFGYGGDVMTEWRTNDGPQTQPDTDTQVRVRLRTGVESWSPRPAGFYEWTLIGSPHDIVEYTVVTE